MISFLQLGESFGRRCRKLRENGTFLRGRFSELSGSVPLGVGRGSGLFGLKVAAEGRECSGGDGSSDLSHQVQIEVQVVECEQAESEDFIGLHEVPQVGAREGAACGALAPLLNRQIGEPVRGVFEV